MKYLIGIPPMEDSRGTHQVMSNRQYQIFHHGAFIYPPVVASAATMLKEAGHDVLWADGEAEDTSFRSYLEEIQAFRPDVIAWEVKTPSVKRTWQRVKEVKQVSDAKIVLFGDHVTALPEETIENSLTDVVITGGDYDYALKSLPKDFKGIYRFPTDTPLTDLPIPDRKLTRYELYGYEKGSGNYKYLPATHSYFGRDCWYRKDGGCTFCSWTNTFKNFRVVTVDRAMSEIESCASLGIREVFDDTGTFPIGKWLHEFCRELIKFNKGKRHGKARITMGCNMRPGALKEDDYAIMGQAGFRFILYGMESANHRTTELINKGQSIGDTETAVRWASKHGMDPHLTLMVGYPWESSEDAKETVKKARELFKKGYAKTLQATICIPYPGTKLFDQCKENGWLKYAEGDWDSWDMRRPVMKSPMSDEEVMAMTRNIYKGCITFPYMVRRTLSIRSIDDLNYILKGARYMFGHLKDFSR